MIDIQIILDVFIDRLKDIMAQNDWNITQLAESLNIPRRTLNSWLLKKRTPRIDMLYQIADSLNVTIDYLVGREN